MEILGLCGFFPAGSAKFGFCCWSKKKKAARNFCRTKISRGAEIKSLFPRGLALFLHRKIVARIRPPKNCEQYPGFAGWPEAVSDRLKGLNKPVWFVKKCAP